MLPYRLNTVDMIVLKLYFGSLNIVFNGSSLERFLYSWYVG